MVDNVLKFLRGSTRPLMTMAFVAALIVGFFEGRIEAMAFIGIVGPVIGFWVNDRSRTKNGHTEG